jgi:hypothetical protein
MPLKLRPIGLGSGIDKDRGDYTVFCGEWNIGRIYEVRGGLNLQWLGFQPCLELCGPRRSGWQLRGPFSLLLLQKFDGIGRSPLDGSAIAANDDPRVQMGASMLIEDPPTPSHPARRSAVRRREDSGRRR